VFCSPTKIIHHHGVPLCLPSSEIVDACWHQVPAACKAPLLQENETKKERERERETKKAIKQPSMMLDGRHEGRMMMMVTPIHPVHALSLPPVPSIDRQTPLKKHKKPSRGEEKRVRRGEERRGTWCSPSGTIDSGALSCHHDAFVASAFHKKILLFFFFSSSRDREREVVSSLCVFVFVLCVSGAV